MATADLDGGRIVIECEYRDRDLIRAVPGAKWIKDRLWRVPLSWATCLAMRGVFGERLEIGPELEAWAWDEHDHRVGPALDAREAALDPAKDTIGEDRLYPFQRTGVAFLAAAGSAILADEMGTGKTVQTIMALEALDAYPALIVAPKAVKRVWADEFAQWAPHRTVQVVESGAKAKKQLLAETDVLVVNYERLRTASRIAGYGSIRLKPEERQDKELNGRGWAAVVADEAHRAKDPKAVQTRALWAVASEAQHVFALTGTPLSNTPEDFWALLRLVSPEEWPSKSAFIDRYCEVVHNYWGGVDITGLREDTKAELYAASDPRFLRRQKALVLPQLPPKTYKRRWVEMAPKQAKAYKEMTKEQVAMLDAEVLLPAFDALTVLRRQSQFACAYAEVDEQGVCLSEPSSKVDALVELLEEMGEEPLVVFAESRQLIDLADARLTKLGITHGRITGAENERQRDDAKHRFQDGEDRVILVTLGAGAEGLTLTRASTLCFLQRSFNAVQNAQAEDRIHRPGQEAEKVVIIDMIAPGTVEESVVLPVLEGKAEMLDEVTRDREILKALLG